MLVTIHTVKGPKHTKLKLSENVITWFSASCSHPSQSPKVYSLNLRDALYVEWGKRTTILENTFSKHAIDQHCLSVITNKTTLDLETISKSDFCILK